MRISEDVLLNKYLPFDEPIPYKDLLISPIKLKDSHEIQNILSILQLDKNNLGHIEFISMSKLRFILIMICDSEEYQTELYSLLYKALSIPNDNIIEIYIDDTQEYLVIGKKVDEVHGHDIIDEHNGIKITSEDFDEIIRIILYQNILDYSDKYIDPDVRKATEEYYRLKNKNAVKVSLEHKVNCVQFKTGMTRTAIGNLSIRNFYQLFNILVDESDYLAVKFAEYNGVKFKTPIENWAYKAQRDKYAEAFCDADSFVNQMQSV